MKLATSLPITLLFSTQAMGRGGHDANNIWGLVGLVVIVWIVVSEIKKRK
jgi:hypothetical protein